MRLKILFSVNRIFMPKFKLFCLANIFALSIGILSIEADETSESSWDVSIEDAVVSTADTGAVSRLYFRIDNLSGRALSLIDVTSPVASSSALVVNVPELGPTDVPSLKILDHEVLDLRSSHLWVELRDLKTPIGEGDMVDFKLVFLKGTIPATAHAHGAGIKSDN